MSLALKSLIISICLLLGACGDGVWVEWENNENSELYGVEFNFSKQMCLLKVSSKNSDSSINVDIAVGRIIFSKAIIEAVQKSPSEQYQCYKLEGTNFTTISSFYERYKWWMVGADDIKYFIVEDEAHIRYLVPDWELAKTINRKLNTLSQ